MIQEHIKITNQLTILQDPLGQDLLIQLLVVEIHQLLYIKVEDIVVLLLTVDNHHQAVDTVTSLEHLLPTTSKTSTLTIHPLLSPVASTITRITEAAVVAHLITIHGQESLSPIIVALDQAERIHLAHHHQCTVTKDTIQCHRTIIIKQDVYQFYLWSQIWDMIMSFICRRKGLRRYVKRKEKKVFYDLLACVALRIDSFTEVED